MLVYDITQEKSFENIKNWIRNIEENASADVEKMLLGNKCELNDKRQVHFIIYEKQNKNYDKYIYICIFITQVSRERGEQLAVEYGIKFMETSAKASVNVEDAFLTLASDIKAKMEKKMVCTLEYLIVYSYNINEILLFRRQITHQKAAIN